MSTCSTHKVLFHKFQLVVLAFLVRELVLVRGALAGMKVAVALPVPHLPVPVASDTFRMAPLVVVVAILRAAQRAMPAGSLLPARAPCQPTLTSFGHPWVHRVVPQQQGGLLPPVTLKTYIHFQHVTESQGLHKTAQYGRVLWTSNRVVADLELLPAGARREPLLKKPSEELWRRRLAPVRPSLWRWGLPCFSRLAAGDWRRERWWSGYG